jgi:imidazolonepropionase-like amidohydrolase
VANILKIFLTEGDKIKQVGSPSQVSTHDGAKIIDLGSMTLLPGLVDGHTHLFLDIVVPPEAEIGRHQNGERAGPNRACQPCPAARAAAVGGD